MVLVIVFDFERSLSLLKQGKLKLAAKDNPLKEFTKRLRAVLPWTAIEDCHLILWARRFPQDAEFREAERKPGESQLKWRSAAAMRARRPELSVKFPTRALEDAYLKSNKFAILEEHEEENLDLKNFDVEEIDSLSEEELGIAGPPHPRSVSPNRWPIEHDKALLTAVADWLKHDSMDVDPNVVAHVARETGHTIDDVSKRCMVWRNAYHSKDKRMKKKTSQHKKTT